MFNKIREFLNKKWVQKCIYFSLIIIPLILLYFKILPTKTNDTLSIINLLVQSEAAVIAIVITLSLVAVQLTASSYSSRVIDIFKESHSFWTIVALYIFAIITGLITLILAYNDIDTYIIQNLILINYYLGIVAFIALIPFIWVTFDLLKPSEVLKKLSQNIQKEEILAHIFDKKKEDPIQPIIDIIHSSCMKSDYTTLNDGLKEIDIIINPLLEDMAVNQEKILEYILMHFRRISKIALNNDDEDAILEIVNRVSEIGYKSIKEKNKNISINSLGILGEIGISTAQKYEFITINVANSIKDISIIAIEKKIEELFIAPLGYLGDIGKITVESRFQYAPNIISDNIEIISKKLAEKNLGEDVQCSIFSLRIIAKVALNHDLDQLILHIIKILKTIGGLTGLTENSLNMTIYALDDIEKVALENKMELILINIAKSISDILNASKKQKNELIIRNGLSSLKEMGKRSIEYKLESTLFNVIDALEVTGKISVAQNMDKLALNIVHIIVKYTYIHEIDHAADTALKTLHNIAKLSISQESENISINIIENFREIGKNALEKANEEKTKSIISFIREIGKSAARMNLDNTVQIAARSIEELLEISINQGFEDGTRMGVTALKLIGRTSIEQKIENSALETIESLRNIGNKLAQQEKDLLALQTVKSLQTLENKAEENDMERASLMAKMSNKNILGIAKEKGLENIILWLENKKNAINMFT